MAQTNANVPCTFVLKNKGTNTPYDLTGTSIEMQFKSAPGPTAALTASTDNGMLSAGDDPTLGILVLNIPRSVIRMLSPGTYYFDVLKWIDANNAYLLCAGKMILKAGITEDATPSLPSTSTALCSSSATFRVFPSTGQDIRVSISGAAPPGASSWVSIFQEQDAPSGNPAAGTAYLYLDGADGIMKIKYPDGSIFDFSP